MPGTAGAASPSGDGWHRDPTSGQQVARLESGHSGLSGKLLSPPRALPRVPPVHAVLFQHGLSSEHSSLLFKAIT